MWTEGTIQVGTSTFHYWVKHYEEPSIYGYEEGRASKITLRRNAETVQLIFPKPNLTSRSRKALAVVHPVFVRVWYTRNRRNFDVFSVHLAACYT